MPERYLDFKESAGFPALFLPFRRECYPFDKKYEKFFIEIANRIKYILLL